MSSPAGSSSGDASAPAKNLKNGGLPLGTRLGATVEDRFLPPKAGLSVSVLEDGNGDAEAALGRLAKKGMDSGMMRDWTFRSPLAPNTNRYEKPTQFRQRIERKGLYNYRQNALLTILRTVLFKKTTRLKISGRVLAVGTRAALV